MGISCRGIFYDKNVHIRLCYEHFFLLSEINSSFISNFNVAFRAQPTNTEYGNEVFCVVKNPAYTKFSLTCNICSTQATRTSYSMETNGSCKGNNNH